MIESALRVLQLDTSNKPSRSDQITVNLATLGTYLLAPWCLTASQTTPSNLISSLICDSPKSAAGRIQNRQIFAVFGKYRTIHSQTQTSPFQIPDTNHPPRPREWGEGEGEQICETCRRRRAEATFEKKECKDLSITAMYV